MSNSNTGEAPEVMENVANSNSPLQMDSGEQISETHSYGGEESMDHEASVETEVPVQGVEVAQEDHLNHEEVTNRSEESEESLSATDLEKPKQNGEEESIAKAQDNEVNDQSDNLDHNVHLEDESQENNVESVADEGEGAEDEPEFQDKIEQTKEDGSNNDKQVEIGEGDDDSESIKEEEQKPEEYEGQESEDDSVQSGKQDHETTEGSLAISNENIPISTQPSSKDENVDYDLLQRQAKYILDSNMLNLPQFKDNSSENKVTALINVLNSNPETSMAIRDYDNNEQDMVPPEQSVFVETRKPARPDLNSSMDPEERDRYSRYLRNENKITEMHDIPPKSRLFIGNLPLKHVSKEDLFRIFSPYGLILQINIKNAFGFIQYDNPQSVKTAIEKESQEMNFGKKLILEISSSNARPQFDHGDHGTNSSSTFISSSKRPFQNDDNEAADMYSDNNQRYKQTKRHAASCVIYVKRTADRGYAYEVFNQFRRGTDLETDMFFLKPRMELRRMINEKAHDGAWGVILVNKTRNVDIQTFYKGPQGEMKFDEYVSVSIDDAIAIFNNLKPSRVTTGHGGMSGNPYSHQQPSHMAGPPQQGYYGGYSMPGHMQGMPPVQQAPYVQQNYPMPMQAQGYAAPPPMAQPFGRYQNAPPPMVDPSPVPQQINSMLGGAGGQMNQQQLLSAIQNLPPAVVSNLLSMAQGQRPQQPQQPQQQSPQAQQQLLGMLQSMQGQSSQQQSAAFNSMAQTAPQMNDNYSSQHNSLNSASMSPPLAQQQQQQQQQQQPSTGSNVQSLLDSLAKLQK